MVSKLDRMLPWPRFSLRSGVICFLAASVFLGLQFAEHYGPANGVGHLLAYYGWPVATSYHHARLFNKAKDWSQEKTITVLKEMYRAPVRYVDNVGFLIDFHDDEFSYLGALVNVGCGAVIALLCAWLAGLVFDRKRTPATGLTADPRPR